ncbi:TonB-dependent receptor [Opitutaceae bacterium]
MIKSTQPDLRSLIPSYAALLALVGNPLSAQTPVFSETVQMESMVVTAAGFEQSLRNAPASISIVDRGALESSRVNSLAEALGTVEGIDIGDTAGKTGGLNISIRGMPSDYSLVLIDGRRQNSAGNITPNGFGESATSFLPPPSAIERIEVIRGPMSTLYGSDAMGGVINIITRKVSTTWTGSLTVGGTLQEERNFGDSFNSNLYASGPIIPNVLGLTLRGSTFHRSASDLVYVDPAGTEVEVSRRGPSPVKADIHTFGARLTFIAHQNHDLWLDLDQAWQTYDNRDAQLGTLGIQGYTEEQKFNRGQYTAAHTWRFGRGQLDTSLMQNRTETIGRTIPTGTPGKVPGSARQLESENIVLDSKVVASFGRHMATFGTQYWEAEMIDGVAPAPYEHRQWALFVEDEWRLVENVGLTLGVRHDDHSQFGGHTNPRAYLVWNATPNWTFKGGVSQGFKVPRLDQLADGITGFTGQGTRPTIGSPGLKPETSTTTEFSVSYDNLTDFTATITAFNNEFDDKIAPGPGLPNCSFATSPNRPDCVDYGNWPAVDLFGQSINVDRAVTRGFEASTRYRIFDAWTLSANYTYTDSEQKSGAAAGQPLTNTPDHMVNARLQWKATPRLNTWLSGEYRSERFRNNDSATSRAKATYGNYYAYELFHLGGSYAVTDRLTLNATIYNLLDKDFVSYGPYVSNTTTGAISYTNLYSNNHEPRRLWMTATITF